MLIRSTSVLLLLALSFFVQAYFLETYPQSILFGDPGAYYVFGQKFQEAALRLSSGEAFSSVYDSVRGYLYFAGVGLLYAALDAVRPGDIPTLRLLLAGFNTLGALGAFFLARELSRSYLVGLTALAISAVYPAFSLQLGRLYPEPVVGALFVWSAYFYLRAVRAGGSATWVIASGFALSTGFVIRAQALNYVFLLLALVLVLTAPLWCKARENRKRVLAFAVGALPLVVLWTLGVRSMGGDFAAVAEHGFFVLPQQQRYPYGMWMFLDSDGWVGPYSLDEYPFYRALEAEAVETPALLTSRPRQYLFALRYLAERPVDSLLLAMDNMYRLYERPANHYKWPYPVSLDAQLLFQKTIVVLALVGVAIAAAEELKTLFVFFVPAATALLHAVSFPDARYNQPVMLILIAAAATALGFVMSRSGRISRSTRIERRFFLAFLSLLLLLPLLAGAVDQIVPGVSRLLRFTFGVALSGAPFLLAYLLGERRLRDRIFLGGFFIVLFALIAAHAARDRTWHEIEIRLDDSVRGVTQEIHLDAPALARLRAAPAAWLLIDLRAPDGNLAGAHLEIDGHRVPAAELRPMMPTFGTATVSGARNPREFPQWWAYPLDRALLSERAPASLRITLASEVASKIRVYADRFGDQDRFYEGPSFGDWPHQAMFKLLHEGDYRIAVRLPLASARTESWLVDRDGERVETRSALRIRIVTLDSVDGYLEWETDEVPLAEKVAVAFYAYSGNGGTAELVTDPGRTLSFPLGSESDFEVESAALRLCHRAEPGRGGMAYGGYLLVGSLPPAPAAALRVQFRSGPFEERLFFSVDRREAVARLSELARRCGVPESVPVVVGVARIVDATRNDYPENTGPWKVAEVY